MEIVESFLFQLLPEELLSQPACQEIIAQYGQSFQDILAFENSPNNSETHAQFNETITNIRHRHQVCLVLYPPISLDVIMFRILFQEWQKLFTT